MIFNVILTTTSNVFDLTVENSSRLNFHGDHVSVLPMKSKRGAQFMGNVIKSHFIFHNALIFNHSRKTMVFFMGHEFKNPHENPINSDTMKKSFSIHGFFIIIKKP